MNFDEEREMPSESNFTISKSRIKELNTLEKSVNRAPSAWLLSTAFFHLFNITSKQCCVLNSFQKQYRNSERILSKNVESCLLINFSNILDITRWMLTGLSFSFIFRQPFLKNRSFIGIFQGRHGLWWPNYIFKK